jgi:hypothetical protein
MTRDEASNTAGPQDSLRGSPLPRSAASVVAIPAPGQEPGYWAGASRAALDEDGTFVIGYRVRNGHDGNDETVIARSEDGERFTTVATLDESEFGAKVMERPSLVRTETGRWRLYVCCADPGSLHWWIDALEADEPEGVRCGQRPHRLPGRPSHRRQRSIGAAYEPGMAGLDLLPPPRSARRGGSHEYGLRHERRRSPLGMARCRSGRTSWGLGRSRNSRHRRAARRARPTMAEPPLKRTGSNAQASHTTVENPDDCDTRTSILWMSDTSMSCRSQTAAFEFTTKPGFSTRATNCARKSSCLKSGMGKRLAEGWI